MENTSPIDSAAKLVGSLTELARMLKVAPPTVHEWKVGRRPVPAARCVDIERVTHGAVTRQQLRPNDWANYWPELAQALPHSAQTAAETVAGQGV